MPTELSKHEKIRRLPWLYIHNSANSAFSVLTWFGPVFVLFLSEIGLPKTRIGILLSFLPFSGVIALFIAPMVARTGVRRVFLICWASRKFVTAFLLFTPWMGGYSPEPAMVNATVAGGMAAGMWWLLQRRALSEAIRSTPSR